MLGLIYDLEVALWSDLQHCHNHPDHHNQLAEEKPMLAKQMKVAGTTPEHKRKPHLSTRQSNGQSAKGQMNLYPVFHFAQESPKVNFLAIISPSKVQRIKW